MRKSLTLEHWAGIRAVAEHEPPTQARIAACAGVHQTTLAKRIASEQWRCLDFRRPAVRAAYLQGVANAWAHMGEGGVVGVADADAALEPRDGDATDVLNLAGEGPAAESLPESKPGERLGLLAGLVVRLCEQLLGAVGAHRGSLSRQQMDTVHALTRLAEKLEPLAQERAEEHQKRSDDEIAAVLRKLEDRIIALAREYAWELAAHRAVA